LDARELVGNSNLRVSKVRWIVRSKKANLDEILHEVLHVVCGRIEGIHGLAQAFKVIYVPISEFEEYQSTIFPVTAAVLAYAHIGVAAIFAHATPICHAQNAGSL